SLVGLMDRCGVHSPEAAINKASGMRSTNPNFDCNDHHSFELPSHSIRFADMMAMGICAG
ncbi:hypothetical protein ACOI1H_21210, partial [Loktanella sp. DJP18]|uniref:hypothetical protein n=1 Tax=Loktanella sp. DJP18 TaxID=3409788 RepID=UPI003BB7FDF3